MALIVDPTTKTVLDLADCYVVFDEDFVDSEEVLLNNGLLEELVKQAGVPIIGALEWVKYGRTTSVSYGPSALRDEAEVLLEVVPADDPEDIKLRDRLMWILNEASDSELAWLGQYILNDDKVWDGYRGNVLDALRAEIEEPF